MAAVAAHLDLSNFFSDSGTQNDPISAIQNVQGPSVVLDTRSRSTTPVMPDEHELTAMRTRALAIRDGRGKGRESSWDNELVDMVLRLTTLLPARAQLLDQAATIRRLSLQRDVLLQRMDDEYARWEAEREGMRRVCEALIAQANIASHNLYKEQENSKRPALIESEIVSLRQKLSDAQSRTSALETELVQLRPLLLMRPNALALSNGLMLQPGKPRKTEGDGSNEGRSYYRVREDKTSTHKSRRKKKASYFKHAPTASDALSEHLLLAARKLGKERATMVSQAMYRTADPHTPIPVANDASASSLMTSVTWQNQQHLWQSGQAGQPVQRSGQQGQQPGNSSPSKVMQNTPVAQFGSPGMAFPHPQHYFMPPGTATRPGTAMPTPTLYHAPRGYIPGPAWPYFSPTPYAFAIQSTMPSSKPSLVRPANNSSSTGPSCISTEPDRQGESVPSTSQNSQESNGTNVPSNQSSQVSGNPKRGKEQKSPQSTPTTSTTTLNNPPTPMDSLLSAARTVFSPSSSSGSHTADDLGSPSPNKRRRVGQPRGQPRGNGDYNLSTTSESSETPERRTSALDVLADQAAGVVPSLQRLASENEERDTEALLMSISRSESVVRRRDGTRKRKQAGEASTSGTSLAPTDKFPGPAVRKGKRPTRALSNASTSRTSPVSLARPTAVPRSASEERTSSATSIALQRSPGSFLLRPVQTTTFSHTEEASARSSSLPESRMSGHRTNDGTGTERGRQANRRAVTPLSPSSTRQGGVIPMDPDIDAEGDEIEPEDVDADAEVDRPADDGSPHQRNGSSRKRKRSDKPSSPSSGRDVNSRRWLEILGRKES